MGRDSEAWQATGKDERREYGKDWGGGEAADGKAEEKQLSHSLRAVSTDPLTRRHHDEFCLMP